MEYKMSGAKMNSIVDRLTKQNYTGRQIINRLKKEDTTEQMEKNQKKIKSIEISIEWKKSRTWGNCPRASAKIEFADGSYKYDDGLYYASGCGYDKESTVIADIFNNYLKYTLWEIEGNVDKIEKKPYGIRLNYDYSPCFEGGVGTSCYYSISEFIGGKFTHITSGKTFDVYKFEMNS